MPNVDGHKPGAQVEMYSFDHDLEEFVAIGLGTVSADGSLIASNPGVGVIKAGWHCGSQPGGSGCTHSCGECATCDASCNCNWDNGKTPTSITNILGDCKKPVCDNGPRQVPDPSDMPSVASSPDNGCKKCDNAGNLVTDPAREDTCCNAGSGICKTGACAPVKIDSVVAKVNGRLIEDTVAFTTGGPPVNFTGIATGSNCDFDYTWDFGDGSPTVNAQNTPHAYASSGAYTVTLKVKCTKCGPGEKTSTVKANMVGIEKLQYKLNGTWTDLPAGGFSDIGLNTGITFKAILKPSTATWPAGCPAWGGDAAGIGEEKRVIFAAQGARTVTAACK